MGFLINFNYLKWLGGTYVIKHLIYCINTFSRNEIEPILIVKKKLSKEEIKEFKEFKLIKTNLFHNQSLIKKIPECDYRDYLEKELISSVNKKIII